MQMGPSRKHVVEDSISLSGNIIACSTNYQLLEEKDRGKHARKRTLNLVFLFSIFKWRKFVFSEEEMYRQTTGATANFGIKEALPVVRTGFDIWITTFARVVIQILLGTC